MIERNFDIPFIANLALREKQIQQNYRPIIAVHKWFARRPGTLFRGLLLSEFTSTPLRESFYKANKLKGLCIADPFMGGGTPLVEANRVGCDVVGYDINPMAYWIVRQEIEHLDLKTYRRTAEELRGKLQEKVGHLYRTQCLKCGSTNAHAKYFLWIKIQKCAGCHREIDLFPGYLISEDKRHPKNVFVCCACGDLTETEDRKHPGKCASCSVSLRAHGPAKRSRYTCHHCGIVNIFPDPSKGIPRHRMFAIEYFCPQCKARHTGRFFKKPDPFDLAKFSEAQSLLQEMDLRFVPDEEIPPGVETDRLHRWGYKHYQEMFNSRQLLGLELSCRIIIEQTDQRIMNALATNLSDLLRYQNMLCRYDTMALKSLDIFSVHGFPVGLVQCESNILGILNRKRGTTVGSGGWLNIIDKFIRAKSYCESPFEVRYHGGRKIQIPIRGEWIGDVKGCNLSQEKRLVKLYCKNAIETEFPSESFDAVLTDPPYYGNVQYAELMDFCYVWLRRLVGVGDAAFDKLSTRDYDELTGNNNMGRGIDHFTEGLSAVFQQMAKALKPGSPMAFTYHHNSIDAYLPVAVAILDSGLTCSASIPCPAEMGASIHISGTQSSIIDTVFVCRSTGKIPRRWVTDSPTGIAQLVADDAEKLTAGGVKPTQGDIRCIIFGQLIRLATWFLRKGWDRTYKTQERLRLVSNWVERIGGLKAVQDHLGEIFSSLPSTQRLMVREGEQQYDVEISF